MRCPKCRTEIDSLINRCEVVEYYEFDGEDYDKVDAELTGQDNVYCCPSCMIVLALDEQEAKDFLAGKLSDKMAERYLEIAFSEAAPK